MRIRRRYIPGKGVVEERVGGEELGPRRWSAKAHGRRGDLWFDRKRGRIEARAEDGRLVGMQLPRGN